MVLELPKMRVIHKLTASNPDIPLWESAPMQSGASSLVLVTADSRVLLDAALSCLSSFIPYGKPRALALQISAVFRPTLIWATTLGLPICIKRRSRDRVPVYVMPRFNSSLRPMVLGVSLLAEQNIVLKTLTHNRPVDVADVQVKPFRAASR